LPAPFGPVTAKIPGWIVRDKGESVPALAEFTSIIGRKPWGIRQDSPGD